MMMSRLSAKVAVLMLIGATVALAIAACGETADCKNLRETTYANKRAWDACDPAEGDFACIKVPGNKKDCTGVLTCDFAVNPRSRDLAELAVYKIGEQSQGCFLCAVPNCIEGELAYCEPISRRCLIATQLQDGGPVISITADSSVPDTSTNVPDATPTDNDSGVGDTGVPH